MIIIAQVILVISLDTVIGVAKYVYLALITVEISLIGFFLMVSSLLVFQTYLIAKNLTTWEFLSWMKISYMKVWPKKHGSPFTRGGVRANFKFFYKQKFTSGSQIYPWRMPKKLPKLTMK